MTNGTTPISPKLHTTWYWQKRGSIPWQIKDQAMPEFANTSTLAAMRLDDHLI